MWPELIRTVVAASLIAGAFLMGASLSHASTPTKAAAAAPLRYLALGDSYTIGESVAEAERWPVQLVSLLNAAGIVVSTPEILATTGWTTDELSAAMNSHEFSPPYDLVSIAIGVNNQYRRRDVENYAAELDALLKRALSLAGDRPDHVFMLSIPDWGVTAFGQSSGRSTTKIASQLDAFNARASELCAKHGIAFVDIMPVSRQRGVETDMQADDGLHPSGALYAEWAKLAAPVVEHLLRSDSPASAK